MLDFLQVADDVVQKEETDVLSSGGVFDTDVYSLKCKYAYMEENKVKKDDGTEKVTSVMFYASFTDTATDRTIRFSECIASAKTGKLKPTYTDKKTNKEVLLPGYTKVVSLLQAAGMSIKTLAELAPEPKTLQLYDFDAGKEVPQEKAVILDMSGAEITAAIYRQVETKMAKDPATGSYSVATAEEKEVNIFEKFGNAEGATNQELRAGEPATFLADWQEMHKGKIRDKRKKGATAGGTAGSTGGTPPAKKKLQFGTK